MEETPPPYTIAQLADIASDVLLAVSDATVIALDYRASHFLNVRS